MQRTQMPTKLLPDGDLNPDWIAGLGETALRQWIASVLQRRDPDFPAWTVPEPHDFLIDAFRETAGIARRLFSDTVADLVRDMADDPASVWRRNLEAGDSLLLLAGETCGEEIAPPVRRMAHSGDFVGLERTPNRDLHARLLQLMMAMRVHENMSFWQAQARRDPGAFLPVAMRGAERSELNPFRVLAAIAAPGDAALMAGILRVTDILTAIHGSPWVDRQRAEAAPSIAPAVLRWLDWPNGSAGTDKQALWGLSPLRPQEAASRVAA